MTWSITNTTAAQARARAQINMGKGLARSTGAPRDEAVDAAHFLIPDGGAARQGDDPAVLLRVPALRHLHARAARIERAAVKAMPADVWRVVLARLLSLPGRAVDVARLSTIRQARR
jgi:hypothetical protein